MNKLGELTGFSQGYISRLESEKRGTKNPSNDMLEKLAEVLGVGTAELLGEIETRFVELDPRYPTLGEALQIRGGAWLFETQQTLVSQANHGLSDLTVGQWIDQGDRLDAQNRKSLPHGRPLDDEDDSPPAARLLPPASDKP